MSCFHPGQQIVETLRAENAALKKQSDNLAFELKIEETLRLKDNAFLIAQRDEQKERAEKAEWKLMEWEAVRRDMQSIIDSHDDERDEAVRAERERCAMLVDVMSKAGWDFSTIAAKIRSGEEKANG